MLRFWILIMFVLGLCSVAQAGPTPVRQQCRSCVEACAAASGAAKLKACAKCDDAAVCETKACAKCMEPCQGNGRENRAQCDLGCPKVCKGFRGSCEANGRGPMPKPGTPPPRCFQYSTMEECSYAKGGCLWFSKGECYGINKNAESAGCYKIRNQEACIKSELSCGWDPKSDAHEGVEGKESKSGT